MRTYIDLTKGIAFGQGKAWEFKSNSSRRDREVCTSLPSLSTHSSRRSVSERNNPPTHTAAENPYSKAAKELEKSEPFKALMTKIKANHYRRNLLHQVCEDLGVAYLGN